MDGPTPPLAGVCCDLAGVAALGWVGWCGQNANKPGTWHGIPGQQQTCSLASYHCSTTYVGTCIAEEEALVSAKKDQK